MKNLVLATVIGAFSLSIATQAFAESDTVTISSAKSGSAIHRVPMTMSEYRPFIAVYELSNGQELRLFASGASKFATLGDGTWHQIVATSSKSFASTDRQLEMTILLQDDGKVGGELLIYSPDRVANAEISAPMMRLAFK